MINTKILVVIVVAISVSAVGVYFFVGPGSGPIVEPTEFGEWVTYIKVNYEDGTTQTLSTLGTIHNNKEISSISYKLQALVEGSNSLAVDFENMEITMTLKKGGFIQEEKSIYNGMKTTLSEGVHDIAADTRGINSLSGYGTGNYELKYKVSGYSKYKEGDDWKIIDLPSSKSVNYEVEEELPPDKITCYQCQGSTLADQEFEGTSCPSGWYEDPPTCEADEVTCYKCEGNSLLTEEFTGTNCPTDWFKSKPDCSNVEVTCYRCNGDQVESDTFQGDCPTEWQETIPYCGPPAEMKILNTEIPNPYVKGIVEFNVEVLNDGGQSSPCCVQIWDLMLAKSIKIYHINSISPGDTKWLTFNVDLSNYDDFYGELRVGHSKSCSIPDIDNAQRLELSSVPEAGAILFQTVPGNVKITVYACNTVTKTTDNKGGWGEVIFPEGTICDGKHIYYAEKSGYTTQTGYVVKNPGEGQKIIIYMD